MKLPSLQVKTSAKRDSIYKALSFCGGAIPPGSALLMIRVEDCKEIWDSLELDPNIFQALPPETYQVGVPECSSDTVIAQLVGFEDYQEVVDRGYNYVVLDYVTATELWNTVNNPLSHPIKVEKEEDYIGEYNYDSKDSEEVLEKIYDRVEYLRLKKTINKYMKDDMVLADMVFHYHMLRVLEK